MDKREVLRMKILFKVLTFIAPAILTGLIGLLISSITVEVARVYWNDGNIWLMGYLISYFILIVIYFIIKKKGYKVIAKDYRKWLIISTLALWVPILGCMIIEILMQL